MENLLLNGLPVPLVDIKDMDDCIIQDMNITLSNEEIVNQWDTKIRRRIASKLSVCQNEKVFEDVLKDYLRLLKEQARNFREKKVLKDKISCHLKVFHLLCYSTREQIGLYMVNYLDYIENILIVLCNLELEVIRHLKKSHVGKEYNKTIKKVARRLIDNLSVNLLNEEKRICHVLLKLDYKHEQSWKDVMHIVYNHYLINLPVRDRSDLSFCRYYLLFQKWKSITDKKKHQVMDKIMYLKFDKTPESITNSSMLNSILLPSTESVVDLVDVLTNGQQVAVNAYFKFIDGTNEDDEIRVPQAIELDSDEDEDAVQSLLFAPSESEKRCNGLIKSERHNKKPVHENAQYVEISSSNGQVVCVIDDESDIEEVCVQDTRSTRRRKPGHKTAPPRPVVSFLDSICLPDDGSSSPIHTPSTEEETASTSPAECTILPIVTAFIDSARRRGTLMETDTQETSTMGLESLSIGGEGQRDTGVSTDIRNTASCSESVQDSLGSTSAMNKNVVGDSNSKNNNINSVVQDVCVPSVLESQTSRDKVTSNEVQSTNKGDKCTCCCRHAENTNNVNNTNNNSANSIESDTNKSNKSVTKPDLKTVEIQTENIDSFSYLCGMITPPSDRTADENSPSSMENICTETEIHNNNNLHSGNTNVYAYVPRTEPYIENNSPNHYETHVEIHSSNYPGFCEISTQVSSFEHQNLNENLSEENMVQSPSENIQEQNSNLEESLENLVAAQTEDSNEVRNKNEVTAQTEDLNEARNENEVVETLVEHMEHPINEIELTAEMEVSEEPISEIHLSEFQNDAEPEEQLNENEFDDTFMEDSEEVVSEFELNETHMDDTELVSEIELQEEALPEILAEVEIPENINSNEQEQQASELEHHSDGSEENGQEDHGNCSTTSHEEYQILNPIEENSTSNEIETSVNNIHEDTTYLNLNNVPVIISESQITDLQEPEINIIPCNLINTVFLSEPYTSAKDIVLIPNIAKDGDESTKITVYSLTDAVEENFIVSSKSGQENDHKKSSTTLQNKILEEKEPPIVADSSATVSEIQSCKIQASVTMAQLVNKRSPKPPKNGEHIKTTRKKSIEENCDKIMYTSNDIMTAPLSLFSRFEKIQSDLVENVLSGPIEPMNGGLNCDSSNSNDSFCLFDADRSTITRGFGDDSKSNSPKERCSPISPPYENIHAEEYENHILRVNMETLSTKPKSIVEKEASIVREVERRLKNEAQNKFEVRNRSSIISKKRKPDANKPAGKRVKFSHTEVRYIPTEEEKLIDEGIVPRRLINEKTVPRGLLHEGTISRDGETIPRILINEKTLPRRLIIEEIIPMEENTIPSRLINEKTVPREEQTILRRSIHEKTIPRRLINEETLLREEEAIPRRSINEETVPRRFTKGVAISEETLEEYDISCNDFQLMYCKPKVKLHLLTPHHINEYHREVYMSKMVKQLQLREKAKAESTCIQQRVDYKKSVEDSLPAVKHVGSSFNSNFSQSAGSSVPSAISGRIDTPRIPSISPPSGYTPALNAAKPGLKRDTAYSRKTEDYGNYNSDSRARTRRKRTPTPKAQSSLLLKSINEPTSSKKTQPQKRRGRPKKAETRSPKNTSNPGVLYSDGPFRIG